MKALPSHAYCSRCQKIRPVRLGALKDQTVDGCYLVGDMLCRHPGCYCVIATFYRPRRVSSFQQRQRKKN